ncbi:F-box/kelch-repeat protein [Panicum miliaceum]|uniref:F-box/kelch-repeat protein n=1 Tax=Panicum miliaceum TaxID=4540 RepID=A0A3L6PRZ2_PANMI|nr:F-box/kelch-repeat protein [Panicum miliaceum]
MLALVAPREHFVQSQASISARMQLKFSAEQNLPSSMMIQKQDDSYSVLIPGLPEDLAKICLALVPRSHFPVMGSVSKSWMAFIGSREFIAVRKEVGKLEEWIYVLTAGAGGQGSHWEMLGSLDQKKRILPPMPGPKKAGFGVVVLDGKLFVMAGYAADHGKEFVSDEVYRYDAFLNRWTALAKMNVARCDFACAEVNGVIYAAGGFGPDGDSLCSVEAYNPQQNKWILIQSLRRPRWGCFACGLNDKLYIMGGRSSFTIGNSRSVDVYDPDRQAWEEIKRGCVMVTSHAILEKRLFCIEWKNQRSLATFNPADNSWQRIPVPLTGSSSTRFCLGVLGMKVLLFSLEEEPGYQTLMYDPAAPTGCEWQTSQLKPSGSCICCVTIEV